MISKCLRCGGEITACMGSVLARDSNLASEGKIPWTMVREHCGRCTSQLIHISDDMNMPDVVEAYLLSIPNLREE